jgi:hypothetical protein
MVAARFPERFEIAIRRVAVRLVTFEDVVNRFIVMNLPMVSATRLPVICQSLGINWLGGLCLRFECSASLAL